MNKKTKRMNWKRILILLIIILLLLFTYYLLSFFKYVTNSKLVDFDVTENLIFDLTDITFIDNAYQFQDEIGYHIVFGHNDKDEDFIVFVPLKKKTSQDDLIVIPGDSIQTKDEIEEKWAVDCNTCKLTSSSPAMINNKALWELTYKDQSNRFVIEYISMENGTTYEKIRLSRKYNEKG